MNIKFKEAFDFTKWVFEKNGVPAKYSNICADVLLSGDQKKIDDWRYEKALELTKKKRPDLLK